MIHTEQDFLTAMRIKPTPKQLKHMADAKKIVRIKLYSISNAIWKSVNKVVDLIDIIFYTLIVFGIGFVIGLIAAYLFGVGKVW